MKSLVAIIGITFSYVFFKISPFFVFAILALLTFGLVLWMLIKIKFAPQFIINIPPFYSNKVKQIEDAMDHVSKSKQAMADKGIGEEPTVVEPIVVVSPQELRRLEIEAEKAEAQRLREREDIKKELLNEIEAQRKAEHEAEYLEKYGLTIEENLVIVETTKTEEVNEVLARKSRLPQKDPNATNDW